MGENEFVSLYLGNEKSSFIDKIKAKRTFSIYRKLHDRYKEIIGMNCDAETLQRIYIELQKKLGNKLLSNLVKNPDIKDISLFFDECISKYEINIYEDASDELKEMIIQNKYGFDEVLESDDKLEYIRRTKVDKNENKEILKYNKKDINTVFEKYTEDFFWMAQKAAHGYGIFNDFEEYKKALEENDNPKHKDATYVRASILSKLLQIYSVDEMLTKEHVVRKEIETGLTDYIIKAKKFGDRFISDELKKIVNNRERYIELADSWDEQCFECYIDLHKYYNYLNSMLKSRNIDNNQILKIKEWLEKINSLRNADIGDIISKKEAIKDWISDFVLDYEVLIRENLLDNVYDVNNEKVEKQTVSVGSEKIYTDVTFEGIIINDKTKINTMLLHFFKQLSNDFIEKTRERYKQRIIKELILDRKLPENTSINDEDPVLISAMKHFDEVLIDRTVADEIYESVDSENDSHICTQTISEKKMKKVERGSYALLFDKNGVSADDIIYSSRGNVESNKGIQRAIDFKRDSNNSELHITSVPLVELIDAEEKSANNEIGISRGKIKPSAICFFAGVPLNEYERMELEKIKISAEKEKLPIILVDLVALNKEKQQSYDKSER